VGEPAGCEPPSDPGSIAGWSPPPWTAGPDAQAGWSPHAADTRPIWRRIPDWLIACALVLSAVAIYSWYLYEATPVNPDRPATLPDPSRWATGESEVAPAEPTGVATPDEIDEFGDLNWG
jgi:hypothetical protein